MPAEGYACHKILFSYERTSTGKTVTVKDATKLGLVTKSSSHMSGPLHGLQFVNINGKKVTKSSSHMSGPLPRMWEKTEHFKKESQNPLLIWADLYHVIHLSHKTKALKIVTKSSSHMSGPLRRVKLPDLIKKIRVTKSSSHMSGPLLEWYVRKRGVSSQKSQNPLLIWADLYKSKGFWGSQ